jgi:hypothetical protein
MMSCSCLAACSRHCAHPIVGVRVPVPVPAHTVWPAVGCFASAAGLRRAGWQKAVPTSTQRSGLPSSRLAPWDCRRHACNICCHPAPFGVVVALTCRCSTMDVESHAECLSSARATVNFAAQSCMSQHELEHPFDPLRLMRTWTFDSRRRGGRICMHFCTVLPAAAQRSLIDVGREPNSGVVSGNRRIRSKAVSTNRLEMRPDAAPGARLRCYSG